MYIDLFSHLFKKYSLNIFSVPRIAAGSDNWNMLLCTMEKESKTQDPGEQVCFWCPLLNQPEGFGSLSSLNMATVHFFSTMVCCDPKVRTAHALGFQPQCLFMFPRNLSSSL